MNMVIFSVYDSCFFCSAVLITDLNTKKFKRVEADNEEFKANISEIYDLKSPYDYFALFDYFDKLFNERIDRLLYLEDGGYVADITRYTKFGLEFLSDENGETVHVRSKEINE